jgi:hypothetical protein
LVPAIFAGAAGGTTAAATASTTTTAVAAARSATAPARRWPTALVRARDALIVVKVEAREHLKIPREDGAKGISVALPT